LPSLGSCDTTSCPVFRQAPYRDLLCPYQANLYYPNAEPICYTFEMTYQSEWTPPTPSRPLLWLPADQSPCRVAIPLSNHALNAWHHPTLDNVQGAINSIMPIMMSLAVMAQDQAIATCKGDPMDWVTDVDKGMEWLWRHWIGRHFPCHHIIGEEFENTPLGTAPVWFIDPIDGTYQFMSRSTRFSMLVGCIDENQILGACVGDARTQSIHAIPVQPSPTTLTPLCIATEYRDQDTIAYDTHQRILAACQGIGSRIGSVGLSLLDVLHGRHSVFYMPNVNAWDIVAPLCLMVSSKTFDCWLRPTGHKQAIIITGTQWGPLFNPLRSNPTQYKVGDVVVTPQGMATLAQQIFECIPLS